MITSQNGWSALPAHSDKLHTWVIPTKAGVVWIRLREGSAGFLLCHLILWIADVIEPLVGLILDDWGYADRMVRGSTSVVSNHGSGTAADINALKHARGVKGTWLFNVRGKTARSRILLRLALYRGCIRWGECYKSAPVDGMHFELDRDLPTCERVARALTKTPRGRRILAANPGQRAVIFS